MGKLSHRLTGEEFVSFVDILWKFTGTEAFRPIHGDQNNLTADLFAGCNQIHFVNYENIGLVTN